MNEGLIDLHTVLGVKEINKNSLDGRLTCLRSAAIGGFIDATATGKIVCCYPGGV
jgi:hypothetical protein